jgi:TonB family protein
LALLCGAAMHALADERRPPASTLRYPDAKRVELPDRLGKPVLVVAPELPAGALADGETASFEIEFTVDRRGQVTASHMVSSTHPALDDYILARHRQWLYAVATQEHLCATRRFRARQRIEVTQLGGKLSAPLAPAEVLEILQRVEHPDLTSGATLRVPNYRRVMRDILYPTAALRAGVEARLALLVQFDADGRVSDVFPVNAAFDEWGFTHAAMAAARRLHADPPPGRSSTACVPVEFRVR